MLSFLVLCLATGTLQFSITEFAVPAEVQAGENAELQCEYVRNNESDTVLLVKWWWTPLGGDSDEKKLIYQRIIGKEAQTLQENIEIGLNDSIVIKSLEPSDSGTYECEVSGIDELRVHKQLTVFTSGSGPQLKIIKVADGPDEDEEEDVLLSCEASGVAPYPDLYITVNGDLVSTSELVSNLTDGAYNISANATVSAETAEGASVRCELSYQTNITHPVYEVTETYSSAPREPSAAEGAGASGDATVSEASADSQTTPPGDAADGSAHMDSSMAILLTVLTNVLLLKLV